jgi:hypothetical protein
LRFRFQTLKSSCCIVLAIKYIRWELSIFLYSFHVLLSLLTITTSLTVSVQFPSSIFQSNDCQCYIPNSPFIPRPLRGLLPRTSHVAHRMIDNGKSLLQYIKAETILHYYESRYTSATLPDTLHTFMLSPRFPQPSLSTPRVQYATSRLT